MIDVNVLEFFSKIDTLVAKEKIDYIDAILHVANQEGLEIEFVASLVKKHPLFRDKVKLEAENLHFLTK